MAVVPRYWSDQFGLQIQVCGRLPGDAEIINVTELRPGRRTAARSGLIVTYQTAGELVGVAAVNASHEFTPLARTVLAGARDHAPAGGCAHPLPCHT